MFDFSATEFLIIALVALIVIGPRELPGLLRQIGQMVGKVRRMASEFQEQLNTAVESSEIQELKTEVGKLADESRIDMDYDPLSDTEREMREAIEGSAPEVHNPDYGNDPDDALVDFSDADASPPAQTGSAPTGEADAAKSARSAPVKPGPSRDNAIVREPSTPRPATPAKRLPVNAGNTKPADSATAASSGGKPSATEG